MKYLTICCIAIACLIGCKKEDPDPNTGTDYAARIDATWQLTKATVDGKDATSSFNGFTVTWKKDKTYTIVNGPQPMWRATGTYELSAVNDSVNPTIILDDQKQLHIIELNETSMMLEFIWNVSRGRRASVSGKYTFEFRKAS